MNLLVFQWDLDLVYDITEFIHVEKRVVYLAFVQVDFDQVVNVLGLVLGGEVVGGLEDGDDAFDEVGGETFLHGVGFDLKG